MNNKQSDSFYTLAKEKLDLIIADLHQSVRKHLVDDNYAAMQGAIYQTLSSITLATCLQILKDKNVSSELMVTVVEDVIEDAKRMLANAAIHREH